MGAWGTGNFENDDAGDWVYDLEKSGNRSVIHQALDAVNDSKGYLEAPDCCVGLVAAETVLAGLTRDHSRVSEGVRNWLELKRGFLRKKTVAFDGDDARRSLSAVAKILRSSELKELWEETEEFTKWRDLQDELVSRLEALT